MHASHFLSIPTPNALSSSYRSATFPLRPSPRTLNLLHSGSFQHESPFPGVTSEARHWHAAICLGLHEAIKSVPLIQTVFLFSNLKFFSTLLFCQKRRDGVLTSQTWDSHGREILAYWRRDKYWHLALSFKRDTLGILGRETWKEKFVGY